MRFLLPVSIALLHTLVTSSLAQTVSIPSDSVTAASSSVNTNYSSSDTHQSSNAKKVFGITLGIDTMDIIKPIVTTSQVSSYGKLSAIGNELLISADLGTVNDAIKFVEFSTNDGKFTAVTLNGVIVDLQVHGAYESWVGDQSFIPSLRTALDKKYKRLKPVKLIENGIYMRTSILYEFWREASGAFTVVLKEVRPKVTNRAACFAYVNVLRQAGGDDAILASRCRGSAEPEFNLFYRVDSEFARAYALGMEAADKHGKAANESRKKELFKY